MTVWMAGDKIEPYTHSSNNPPTPSPGRVQPNRTRRTAKWAKFQTSQQYQQYQIQKRLPSLLSEGIRPFPFAFPFSQICIGGIFTAECLTNKWLSESINPCEQIPFPSMPSDHFLYWWPLSATGLCNITDGTINTWKHKKFQWYTLCGQFPFSTEESCPLTKFFWRGCQAEANYFLIKNNILSFWANSHLVASCLFPLYPFLDACVLVQEPLLLGYDSVPLVIQANYARCVWLAVSLWLPCSPMVSPYYCGASQSSF